MKNLRVALFSGNYNYVRDGANQALNRLVDYLERGGAVVRVYSPTTQTPAFEPKGTLVSVPSVAAPGRAEYRIALGLPRRVRQDLENFAPNIIHLSAPDPLGAAALRFARKHGIPCVASVHTRFDTYLSYYKMEWLESAVRRYMRNFYAKCAAVMAPCDSMVDALKADRIANSVGIWSRGVDADLFNPTRRTQSARDKFGLAADEIVIGFVGRLVLEKGIDIFSDTVQLLQSRGFRPRVLIVGDGPARAQFQQQVPDAIFAGFQKGEDLADAYACMDIFLNPSITEAFGNVTVEAMASGCVCVCANATGAVSIVHHMGNGFLSESNSATAYSKAVAELMNQPELRARLGKQARIDAMQRDWDSCLADMTDAYLEVLGLPLQSRNEKIGRAMFAVEDVASKSSLLAERFVQPAERVAL